MIDSPLSVEELEVLRVIPTPAVSNAIETLDVRPRNAGYIGPEVRQMFPASASVIGYAVTVCTVSAHKPGLEGPASRADYWRYVEASGPRPLVALVKESLLFRSSRSCQMSVAVYPRE